LRRGRPDGAAGARGPKVRAPATLGTPPSPPPPRDRSPAPPPARVRPPTARWPGSPPEASSALEEALALVAGDRLVEELLLGARVVQVVVDDVITEGGTCDLPVLERGDRLI